MRVYICKVTQHLEAGEPTSFEFVNAVDGAWFWKTRDDAQRALAIWQGITVEGSAECLPCTDFRFESRPQGGFVISCEHPFPEPHCYDATFKSSAIGFLKALSFCAATAA
jgi:hypothetical protein